MDRDKWLGISCLVFGIIFLWYTIKTWTKGDDLLTGNIKGLIASIFAIIGGILFLVGKLHW